MKYKKKLFLVGLIFLVFLNVVVVSAEDNITETMELDNNIDKVNLEIDDTNSASNSKNENLLNNEINEKNEALGYTNDSELISTYTPVISFSDLNLYYTDSVNLKIIISVKELPGYYYPNANIEYCIVNFGLPPDYYIKSKTDSEGLFKVNTYNMNPGKYTIHVNFYGTYKNETLTINKIPITIKSPQTIKVDNVNYFTLKAHLIVPNRIWSLPPVYLTIDGKTYVGHADDEGDVYYKLKLPTKKTYDYSITVPNSNCQVNDAKGKIIVGSFNIKISAMKHTSIIGENSLLKATITNGFGQKMDYGVVNFKINGKSYKVKVKNGVATKKIKLPKIKTYNYKATYSSEYIKSKSDKSKIIVKKIPTFKVKIGKYSVKINYKDYKKIKRAQNNGYFSKKYYTGKTTRYNFYVDKKITHTKKKLYSYGTYTTYYKNNPNALIAPKGYKFAGRNYKVENGIEKVYMVYKKTSYKKILTKTPQTKVYITIDSNEWWGTTAQLYHKESAYKHKYGGTEVKYYLGKQKDIF